MVPEELKRTNILIIIIDMSDESEKNLITVFKYLWNKRVVGICASDT